MKEHLEQLHRQTAAEGESSRSVLRSSNILSPPLPAQGGGLKRCCCFAGRLAEQKGAIFLKIPFFLRQKAKSEFRVCKSVPRLVFCFTKNFFEIRFSHALRKWFKKYVLFFKNLGFSRQCAKSEIRGCKKCAQAIVLIYQEKIEVRISQELSKKM